MHFYKFCLIPLFFITSLFAFEEGYVYNDDIKIV
ncbi:MAG: alpha/beta hydrolase, partial [Proteobacteria bacterium]|nr:alpha/beta hydrolase [Pseudomonadota bacterium]